MEEYYFVKKEQHESFWSFDFQIDWNVKTISGGLTANGYIVQHFKRTAVPSQPLLDNIEYYEAWQVTEGECEKDPNQYKEEKYDDAFSVGDKHDSSLDIHNSLGTKGAFIINADVYWIPRSSHLYGIIDKWPRHVIKQAGELKATYCFPELTVDYFVFSRPEFKHEWDFVAIEIVDRTVRDKIFKFCQKYTERDIWLLNNYLDNVFDDSDPKYQVLKDAIRKDWIMQRSSES